MSWQAGRLSQINDLVHRPAASHSASLRGLCHRLPPLL